MADPKEAPQAEASRPIRWGMGDAVLGLVVGLVLTSVLASIWLGATGDDDLSLGGQAFAQLGLWTGLAGAAVFASRIKGAGSLAEDFGLQARRSDVVLGIPLGVFGQVVLVWLVAQLLRPILGDPDVSGPVEDLFDSAKGIGTAGLVLFVVVGAPFVEELFFRGLLLRAVMRRFGPVWAVVVSSVVFGLAHPQPLPAKGQVLVMVSLAAFGALLGFVTVRTGRLGAAIVTHAAFNAWTTMILLGLPA